jgi:hypothetical protein
MAYETLPQQNKALYQDASKDQQLVILYFVLLLKAAPKHGLKSFSPRSWRQTMDATDEGHHLDPIEEAEERVDSGCAITVAGPRWTSLIPNGHSGIAPSIEICKRALNVVSKICLGI